MAIVRDTFQVADGDLPVVRCAGRGKGPSLIIVPSIFGIDDGLVEQMEELAHAGALVVAMDPFWRVESGVIPHSDFQAAIERVQKADTKASYGDFVSLLRWARGNDETNGRVIGLGICFGGPFCFRAAARGLLDGVVTWHGSRLQQSLEDSEQMKCPMQLHFGGADRFVPTDAVEQVRAAFSGRDDVTIAVHDGADHGFSHRGSAAFQAEAERAGMDGAKALIAALS